MTELAYIERTDSFTTTNTAKLSTTAVIDNSFDRTVVGTGAAVVLEFYCPAMANSSSLVTSWFVQTVAGVKTAQGYRNWSASSGGAGGSMRLRMVLANGVSYKFEVGLSATAGTTTANGSAVWNGPPTGAMFLRVTD
jgi:hypothetical protein